MGANLSTHVAVRQLTNLRESIMAARIRKHHQDEVRLKIQASQLINLLQNHALKADSEISPSRMKAIEILLRKSVPDLTAITLGGDEDNPLNLNMTIGFVATSAVPGQT